MLTPDPHRFRPADRLEDGVTVPFEHSLGNFPDRGLVFHEQNGFLATQRPGRGGGGAGQFMPRLASWQKNAKGRSSSNLAVDANPAAVLFHDAKNGGEAEAGALARLLG